jgi:hypothetical protein
VNEYENHCRKGRNARKAQKVRGEGRNVRRDNNPAYNRSEKAMIKTTYYFFIKTYDPTSPDYMKPASVHRWRREGSGTYLERWNGQEWVANNNLIAACGIGGDNNYEMTTEAEAMKFLASHTKDEK